MLIEQSKKLIELSQRKIDIQKYANNLDGFKTRRQQITQALQEVFELVESLRLFRDRGLIAGDFTVTIDELLEFIQFTLIKYQEQPEWILDNTNFNEKRLQAGINKITSTLRQQLVQAWQNYLTRKLPSTNAELLNLLWKVEDFKPTIQRIRQLEVQIKSDKFPKYSDEFEHTEHLIQKLNDEWDTLNAENVSDEVLSFLKAAASNMGASLDLLTPEVKIWLEDHNLSHTLRIRLS